MKSMKNKLGFQAFPKAKQSWRRAVLASLRTDVFSRHPHPNAGDKNSSIEVFYQTGPSCNFRSVLSALLCDILEERMFHELRTVQQHGYTVILDVQDFESTAEFSVVIQSTIACPDVLLGRIDDSMTHARPILTEMTEEKFSEYAKALIVKKSQPDASLFDSAKRFWTELNDGMQNDRPHKEVEVLRCLKKKDLMEFFDDYVVREGSKRRRIVSQVFGALHPYPDREEMLSKLLTLLLQKAIRKLLFSPS